MTEVTSNTHLTHASYVAVGRPLKATSQPAAARGAWEDIGAVFGIALLLAIIALVLLAAPAALEWIAL